MLLLALSPDKLVHFVHLQKNGVQYDMMAELKNIFRKPIDRDHFDSCKGAIIPLVMDTTATLFVLCC